MPDTKISALTALTVPASGDLIPIVDVSDTTMAASGTTKGIAYSNLGFLPLAGGTMTGTLNATAVIATSHCSGDYIWVSGNSSGVYFGSGQDTILYRDAISILAQRNGTAAQTLRVYGTHSGAGANYVRASLSSSTTEVTLAAQTGGTGADDVNIVLAPAGVGKVNIGAGASSSLGAFFSPLTLSGTSAYSLVLQNNGTDKVGIGLAFAANDSIVGSALNDLTIRGNGNNIVLSADSGATTQLYLKSDGKVGIGTASPSYQLHVNTDSAGKPGVGGLWTVVSDERIKTNIVPADLSRCYDIVKQVGLKHFGFKPGVYTDSQVQDKNSLGWIAQDVQKVFGKAVSIKPFTLQTDIPDGTEEYEEQAFTVQTVSKVEKSIQIVNGRPVQVSKDVQTEEKTLLFDDVIVVDEEGQIVMVEDEPLTHKVPRMVTKTRPKVRREVIEDCLDLNGGQMNAALYGAVQHLMGIVEAQAEAIAELQANV